MIPTGSIVAGVDGLRANPLRTALSTLGVTIGVASLVAILAIGDGLERYGRDQIGRTTDLQAIVIRPRTSDLEDGIRVERARISDLTAGDAEALRRELGGSAVVALMITGSARAGAPEDTTRHAVLVTAIEDAAAPLFDGVFAGRFFREADGDRTVVVPASVAEWFGVPAGTLPGRTLLLDGTPHSIIGVDSTPAAGALRLMVPLTGSTRAEMERPDRRVEMLVRASRVEEVEGVRLRVEAWLQERFAEGAFAVASRQTRVRQARQGFLVLKLALGSIAGISLLVGGVGIMNIMLASVAERTREIGIRKATGAREADIVVQFLAEAAAVSGVGTLAGVALGLGGAYAVAAVIRAFTEAQMHAAFSPGSVLFAAGAGLGVGLLFGTYPARRAAALSPIDAIRHE